MHRLLTSLALLAALAGCSPAPSEPSETPAAAPANATPTIEVASPHPGDRVTSPLVATGTAPGAWYFEAQFAAQLIGPDSRVLVEAPARAEGDWMTQAPVPFRAELPFTVAHDTQAVLLLQEDMPPDADHPEENRPIREIRIPVVLTP